MQIRNLDDVFHDMLRDTYDAEKQLTKAIPKMMKAADSLDLKSALEQHLKETETQVARLEQVFDELGMAHRGKKCDGMEGIIDEGSAMLKEDAAPEMRDALIIAAAQKVEHYEIATYGTLCRLASVLGHSRAKQILGQTLVEEKTADEKLTEVAEQTVYPAYQGAHMARH
jgi:ferritin-like metal-binding protein YciE